MKHSIFLPIILSLSLICSNQIYSNNLKDKLINTSLILGGMGLAWFINFSNKKGKFLAKSTIRSIPKLLEEYPNHPKKEQIEKDLEEAKQRVEWFRKTKNLYLIGLLMSALGIYRACK